MIPIAGVVTDVPALLNQVQSFHPDILLLDWKLAGMHDSHMRQQLVDQLTNLCYGSGIGESNGLMRLHSP